MHDAAIRVGVAGWDYPDWQGIVYPARAPRRLDRLAFLARFVDLIEINSTFYRPVDPRVAASWADRTRDRPGFRFTAKAHRSWTHEPDDLAVSVATTLSGLTPLREAGSLTAVLLQFPQSFRRSDRCLDHLARLLDLAAGWPLVVEVRHVSWDCAATSEWLGARGAGWCVVDQPAVGHETAPRRPRVTAPVAYLRLHGRNRRDWFRRDAGRDARYDYLYSRDELAALADDVREMARSARELVVVQNNHFRGKALVNALQMKHLVEGSRPAAPSDLVRAYPEIETQVRAERDGLF